MNNIQCQIPNHNGKKIIAICMDKQCKKYKFCCFMCTSEYHSFHQNKIVEIDEIHSFIEQVKNREVAKQQSSSYEYQYIIKELEQFSTLIDSIQIKIKEEIERIKQRQQSFQEFLQNQSKSQEGMQNWNELLEGILQYVEIQDSQLTIATFKEGQLNQVEERYIKIIKQSEEILLRAVSQMNISQMHYEQLSFKENRKNVDIVVIENCTIKKTIKNSYSIAFADEGFDPNHQSYQFAFNIQPQAQNVWVGIGNAEENNLPQYFMTASNISQLGHGLYLISHNGYTYHHSDAEINLKVKGMNFKGGEKIQIKYDHATKVLEFRKESDQKIVKMVITDMSKRLFPCALLYYPDDSVKIVEY